MTPQELKQWRATLGWTQARTAKILGLSRETIVRYEGGTIPIPRTVHNLCAVLTAVHTDTECLALACKALENER